MPLNRDVLWYKDAIIYQVHVRTFHDSNGDGIGDFQGLEGKLDYLQKLGINAIWLMPFFPSPLRDDRKSLGAFLPPVLGFVFCLAIWTSLHKPALVAGGIWLTVGIIYAAIKTNGFRQ